MSSMPNGEKQPLTQKQKTAVVVCAVCALALIITASVTGVLVSKKIKAVRGEAGSQAASGDYSGSDYVIDSSSVLAETADAGDDYLKETLFIGDSNTVRMNNNGLISLQQFCAQEGLGIQSAVTEQFVAFKDDSKLYTIPQAVAMMKPRRVVITLGTNNADGSMSTEEFVAHYKSLITAIRSAYSYTDIIVNAIPPLPSNHAKYPDLDQSVIDAYNMALATLCEDTDCRFLNSAEALKDTDGYGISSYYVEKDIHMTLSGLKTLLSYYRTHAYESEDRRPEADQNAVRPQHVQSSGSQATAEPAASPTAQVKYTASYFVESGGGGTLSCGSDTGKTSLKYDVTDTTQSFTVTAVPATGYVFSKWSDGVTSATRTDTNFKKNVNVTAVFLAVNASVSTASSTLELDKPASFTFAVTIGGKTVDVATARWYYTDGSGAVTDTGKTGASYTFTPTAAGSYTVTVKFQYNGTEITASTKVTVVGPSPTPSATPEPTPSPTPEPTPVPTPEPPTDPTPNPPESPETPAE